MADPPALSVRSPALRRVALLALATAVLLVAAHWLWPGAGPRSTNRADRPPTTGAPLSYGQALALANGLLAGAQDLAATRGGE